MEQLEYSAELIEHNGPSSDDQLLLLTALMQGDNKTFHHLLQQTTVNPNHKYRNQQRSTCIHIAARRGNHTALYLLSQDGRTHVNEVDQYGRTALHLAAKYFDSIKHGTEDYEKCIKILMKWPEVDVNIFNRNGFTPIYEAILANKKEAVQAILKYGQNKTDMDKLQGDGNSARKLMFKRFPEMVTVLSPVNSDLFRYDPYIQLLDKFKNQQFDHFQTLLYSINSEGIVKLDPNHFYEAPYNATLLEMACKQDGSQYTNYVQLLLNAGADPNIINPITNQTPLHLAAQAANSSVLKTLISRSNIYINLVDGEGKTALHILSEKPTNLKFEKDKILKCILLLLQNKKLDINICDYNGLPVILAAAERGNSKIVAAIIQNCRDKLDLENIVNNQMFNDLVQICPELKTLTETKKLNVQPRTCRDINVQPRTYRDINMQPRTYRDINEQLFQHLYSRDIEAFKKIFLEQVDNGTHKNLLNINNGSHTFLQYAARYGLNGVAKVLLSHGANPNAIHPRNNKCPLILACIHGHHEILTLLVKSDKAAKININATDIKGNTALYYAAWNKDLRSVVTLLRHGATLHHRNIYDNLPITNNAMKSLLDQCVRSSGHPEDDDYKIEFDYSLLLAYRKNSKQSLQDSTISIKALFDDDQNSKTKNEIDEATLLANTDPESRNTEKNIVKQNEGSEMEFLHYISIYEDYRSLLIHPVVRSFLYLKWLHVTKTYYINLFMFILYMILLNTYILTDNKQSSSDLLSYSERNDSNIQVGELKHDGYNLFFILGLKVLVTFVVSCFAIREICQCIGSTRRYIRNIENYLDIGMIITTIIVMHNDWSESKSEDTLIVVAIILSWLELVLIIGRHPLLSKNIAMLKAVSKNYFWFLFTYSFLIVAFALSFYRLFHENINQFFKEPGTSIFKTIIMMNGEYDTSTFAFKMVDITTYIVYVLFVLFIGIVLNNLLTGLAVNDTQSIMQIAEQLSLVSRIKLIYEMEHISIAWSQFLKKLCPSIMIDTVSKLERNVNIFQHKELYILPNKHGKIIFGNNLNNSKITLDLDILCAAMKITAKDENTSEFENINLNLEDIKTEQKKIFELQQASLIKLQTGIDNTMKKADQNQRSAGKFHNKLNVIKQKVDEDKFKTEQNTVELKIINKKLTSIEMELPVLQRVSDTIKSNSDIKAQSSFSRPLQETTGNPEREQLYSNINNRITQIETQVKQCNSELNKSISSHMETQQLLKQILEKLNNTR